MSFLPGKRGNPWRCPRTLRSLPDPPLCLEVRALSHPVEHTVDSNRKWADDMSNNTMSDEHNHLDQFQIFVIYEIKLNLKFKFKLYLSTIMQQNYNQKKKTIIWHLKKRHKIITKPGRNSTWNHLNRNLTFYVSYDSTLIRDQYE